MLFRSVLKLNARDNPTNGNIQDLRLCRCFTDQPFELPALIRQAQHQLIKSIFRVDMIGQIDRRDIG